MICPVFSESPRFKVPGEGEGTRGMQSLMRGCGKRTLATPDWSHASGESTERLLHCTGIEVI